MSKINETHDNETDFLAALTSAFTMRGHLQGTGRIGSMSDEDASLQLDEARQAMARLRPVSVDEAGNE